MKSAVLNVSIDTDTAEGEKLRDLILGGDNRNGWLCVAWVDRQKYNPVELLKQSEEARRTTVDEAIRLNGECMKMKVWIEKARDLMVYYDLFDKPSQAIMLDAVAKKFGDLIDEAPL